MPTYEISTEVCLGYSHCGGEYCYGSSSITLTDGQAERLRRMAGALLSEGKDLEEFDLRDTDLVQEDPALYRALYDAYYNCAYEAEYEYWVVEGYSRSEVLDGIDWDHDRKVCKERYGYNPEEIEDEGYEEFDEDEEIGEADEAEDGETDEEEVEAEYDMKFQNWFRENIAYSDKVVDFERKENLLDIEVDIEFDSPLLIPEALVKESLDSHDPICPH